MQFVRTTIVFLLFLSGMVGQQCFAACSARPEQSTTAESDSSDLLQIPYQTAFGIAGESYAGIGAGPNSVTTSPARFDSGNRRQSVNRHRSRTALARHMIRRFQTYFLFFRGTPRCESTPYSCTTSNDYYIFALWHIRVRC